MVSIHRKSPKYKYRFENNLFERYDEGGQCNQELVEWIDKDNFMITVLDGESSKAGKRRAFTKIG